VSTSRRWAAVLVMALTVLVVWVIRNYDELGPPVLVSAEPAADARVEAPPAEVSLTFVGPVDPVGTHLEVIAPDGSTASFGELMVSGDTVTRAVDLTVEGAVLVTYHGVLRDGRQVTGQHVFQVGEDTGAGQPRVDAAGHAHGEIGPLAAIAFAAIFVSGVAILVMLVGRPGRRHATGYRTNSSASRPPRST
jgi:methionine-rich copper-binding protein CopC